MKITEIETIQAAPDSFMPGLLFVRILTDEGIHGTGDTFYLPATCASVVHEHIAGVLLGQDPRDIEKHWRTLYNAYCRFGGRGAEVRALSAVDVALWDILGKSLGAPVHRLLGTANDRVATYNTCGGPLYSAVRGGSSAGYGSPALYGELDDFDSFLTRPGELAAELVAEGAKGMKLWPFDRFAHAKGGRLIEPADLAEAVGIVERIREAVGDELAIMIDGHGLWELSPAIRIAQALEPFSPAWLEDLILANKPTALARLRESANVPVSVSEYLVGREDYLPVLQQEAADLIMVDPTWAGGITESRKIAALADSYGLPVTYHDCTGPFTLLAGLALAFSSPNAMYQESVRAYLRIVYPDMVTEVPEVREGTFSASDAPGLGAELLPGYENRQGVVVRKTSLADLR